MNRLLFALLALSLVIGALLYTSQLEAAAGCGPELTNETTLLYDFGISPAGLPGRSDQQFLDELSAFNNSLELQQIAITRSLIWNGILAYRTEGQFPTIIPAGAGSWRSAEVTHPTANRRYDVVHWRDIDDGSFSIFFRKNTTDVCVVSYEN